MNDIFIRRTWRFVALAVFLLSLTLYCAFCANRSYNVFRGIPSQTAVVLNFNGFLRVTTSDTARNKPSALPLPAISIIESANAEAGLVASLFRHNAIIQEAFNNRALTAAFSLQAADSLQALFILDLGQEISAEQLTAGISGARKVFSSTYKGQLLFTLYLPNGEKVVLAVKRNVLLFSRFSYLVEDAMVQLDHRGSWWAKDFGADKNDKTDLFRIIVRTEVLAERLVGQIETLWAQLPDWFAQKTEWCSLGLNEKGTWRVSVGMQEALPRPGTLQEPGRSAIFSILPDNTALLAWAGLRSPEALSGFLSPGIDRGDFQQFIQPWAGHEIAYAIIEPYSAGMSEDQFIVLKVQDSTLARYKLQEYGAQHGLIKQYDYQTFAVNQFLSQSLLAPLTGSRGASFQNPVCVILGDYAVFASTGSAIELLIDKYIVNQTLANAPDFLQLQKKRTQQGDVSLFFNCNYVPLFVKNIFGTTRYPEAGKDIQALQQTGVVCLDFPIKKGRQINTTVVTQPVGEVSAGVSILWKTTLGSAVVGAPSIVRLSEGQTESAILIQDDQNQLYRFSAGGEVVWRKQIEQPILSGIYGIDFYRNGRPYYLFNTSDAIWILDDEGHEIEGFPLQLQSPATNGVLMVDFHNTRDYSLFIACENGNLYGFDQFGRPITGWNPQSGAGRVQFPLIHFKWDDRDYLAALSVKGKLSVFNRNGAPHFTPVSFNGTFNNCPPQFDDFSKSPRIVCMNTEGRIFVSNLQGETSGVQFAAGGVNERPFMVYGDLTDDGRKDFAAVWGQHFRISGYEGTTLKTKYNNTLSTEQDTLFQAGCCGMLGSLNRAKRQIYLMDKTGNPHPDFPLAGTTPFVLGRIFQSRKEHILIAGNGNALYAYKIK